MCSVNGRSCGLTIVLLRRGRWSFIIISFGFRLVTRQARLPVPCDPLTGLGFRVSSLVGVIDRGGSSGSGSATQRLLDDLQRSPRARSFRLLVRFAPALRQASLLRDRLDHPRVGSGRRDSILAARPMTVNQIVNQLPCLSTSSMTTGILRNRKYYVKRIFEVHTDFIGIFRQNLAISREIRAKKNFQKSGFSVDFPGWTARFSAILAVFQQTFPGDEPNACAFDAQHAGETELSNACCRDAEKFGGFGCG